MAKSAVWTGVKAGPAVPAVPAAVAECPEAGIRVVMITGDYPATAVNIARRVGRRIFDNLRKAMTFIFSVHLPIAGMTLLPVLFGWPLALMPVHVPFLELIIDPACTIIVEMEEEERRIRWATGNRPHGHPDQLSR